MGLGTIAIAGNYFLSLVLGYQSVKLKNKSYFWSEVIFCLGLINFVFATMELLYERFLG